MDILKFHYNFNAVPLARQRVTRTGHCYNPTSNKIFRSQVRLATLSQIQDIDSFVPIQGRVHCNFEFFKPTQTYYKRFGDIDNLVKAVMDSYNNLIWIDDSQVVSIHAKKITGIEPHFNVTIVPLDSQIL